MSRDFRDILNEKKKSASRELVEQHINAAEQTFAAEAAAAGEDPVIFSVSQFVTRDRVYELACDGLDKKAIAKKIGVSLSGFYNHCNKHPEIAEALVQGNKEYFEGVKAEVGPVAIEALKTKLRQGDMKAIELAIKNILGYGDNNTSTTIAPQIGIMPNINFDFAKLAPDDRVRKLEEMKKAKSILLEADADVTIE